jgi:hypothetical protein
MPRTSAAEHRRQFATDRSHKAAEIAYDFCKATAQACLLINGGAATAVIAFMSKDKIDPHLFRIVPWCLAGYAIGVLMSAGMIFCEMMNADNWNYSWYCIAYEGDEKAAEEYQPIADRWHSRFYYLFAATIACFLLSSIALAISLTNFVPVKQ